MAAVKGVQALRVYLEMIKFEHSVFALPFAMVGMVWGSIAHTGAAWPGVQPFIAIIVAMVSCRSAAMAYNRIVDRDIDSKNPRTANRAIPAGVLALNQASLFFIGSCVIFFAAAASLNPLALALSPIALGVTLGYSWTKRFTWLCHFVLGLSLGIAPAAAWIAVTGSLSPQILPLVGAVALWTAGFDILYSLQDESFDRVHGLHSLPRMVGIRRSLVASRACHVMSIVMLVMAVLMNGQGILAWLGVAFAALLLAYEQSLVKEDDLSQLNLAFFTLNGFVSIGVFVFFLLDVLFVR